MSTVDETPEKEPQFFIWTIQLGKWRKCRDKGIFLIDITAKTGNPSFAPNWIDLMEYKKGKMSEEEYTERYLEKMSESMSDNKEQWDSLSRHPYSVYGCYCAAGEFCHRHLFKNLAQNKLEQMGWVVKQMGELTPETDYPVPDQYKLHLKP